MNREEKIEAWKRIRPRIDFNFFGPQLPVAWLKRNTSIFLNKENIEWFQEMDELYGEEG